MSYILLPQSNAAKTCAAPDECGWKDKTERSLPLPQPGFDGRYEVTDSGRVISLQRNGVRGRWPLVQRLNSSGYPIVTVTPANSALHGINPSSVRVHRMVALAFLDKPTDQYYEVNHKDGNKRNNTVDNLEWVTRSENHLHSHRTGLHNEHTWLRKRPVIATHAETGDVREFYCINDAVRYGFKSGAITLCCQGKQKVHHGYTWRYAVLDDRDL